jgi:hypothetical protein
VTLVLLLFTPVLCFTFRSYGLDAACTNSSGGAFMTLWSGSCVTFQGALAASLDSCSASGGHLTVYRSNPPEAPPVCSGDVFMGVQLPTTCQFSMLFNAFIEVNSNDNCVLHSLLLNVASNLLQFRPCRFLTPTASLPTLCTPWPYF